MQLAQLPLLSLEVATPTKQINLFEAFIHPPHTRFLVGCSSPFMSRPIPGKALTRQFHSITTAVFGSGHTKAVLNRMVMLQVTRPTPHGATFFWNLHENCAQFSSTEKCKRTGSRSLRNLGPHRIPGSDSQLRTNLSVCLAAVRYFIAPVSGVRADRIQPNPGVSKSGIRLKIIGTTVSGSESLV